jgi:2-phosphosulfolactate phosphatase
VFDVLRATTTMVSAIAAGAREVRVFDSLDVASAAAKSFEGGAKLLCGERNCLPPAGFDLGNSPGDFKSDRVKGSTIFLSTTNGTRAIVAANAATSRLVAGLINRRATAEALLQMKLDVTLLCAGTNQEPAPEDLLGAGAVIHSLNELTAVALNSVAIRAGGAFHDAREDLVGFLRSTAGGRNVIDAGLEQDIVFASRLDAVGTVVEVSGDPPVARRMIGR